MADVDVLDKWFHGATPLLNLLLRHATGDLAWAASNAGDKAVGEALVTRVAIFDVFDNDGLLSRVTTSEDDDYFSRFDDCHFN